MKSLSGRARMTVVVLECTLWAAMAVLVLPPLLLHKRLKRDIWIEGYLIMGLSAFAGLLFFCSAKVKNHPTAVRNILLSLTPIVLFLLAEIIRLLFEEPLL